MSGPLANAHLRLVRPDPRPSEIRRREEPSEDELLDAIERGDASLGGEVCRRLIGVVDATLVRVLGRRESDHEDLMQAALEQVVLTIHNGKFSRRCTLATWAAAIASNIALHAIRRRRTERGLFDHFEDVEHASPSSRRAVSPEATYLARQELERVRFHLSRMSERIARTLVLHDVLGCDLTETAELLGASESATQSRLSRGRRELSARLLADERPGRRW